MTHDPRPPTLETERLILRGHTRDDFEACAAMWADPDIVAHISGTPSSRRDSWLRLLRLRGLWPVLGYGYWAMSDKSTGRFAGDIGFADFKRELTPSIDGIPEAGWVLPRHAHGRGLATEALAAILHWLDTETGHRRSVCLVAPANRASLRVAEKAGYTEAATVAMNGEETILLERLSPRP